MSRNHCGLDFGTSNSTLGRVRAGVAELLPLEGGDVTIPSVIFFSFEDDDTHFGRRAIAEYAEGVSGRLMRSLKSVLGTSLMNETTRVRQKRIAFGDIVSRFVSELRQRAERSSGETLTAAVVGRPVQFVDDDPLADREAEGQLAAAVKAAGFEEISFQYEPIAAALDHERHVTGEELALVADIGGGTSDFTIIRLSPEGRRRADRSNDILATAGVHVGGTDFDQLLSFRAVMPKLGHGTQVIGSSRLLPNWPFHDLATWHRINRLYAQKPLADIRAIWREAERAELVEHLVRIVEHHLGHALAGTVEAVKIALSEGQDAVLDFERDEVSLRARIDRAAFDRAIAPAADRIPATIRETLKRAGLGPEAIEVLILTGGSTRIPYVRRSLDRAFPDARIVETDAFGSVGIGLSIEAERRYGT
ncbi:MAG: Hsp70 family protein [Hyphomicrobiaceae bacterium]|nr:Hsp70 family protein [Hyphomicrobiaceae bacterium]